ncbi:MAG: UDP-N-acetylglucosamine 1-carboxyvinyltransferase [Candidatus Omnitrophota bacterium]
MDKLTIHQSKLSGNIVVSGSKNAALPIMAATILTDDKCVIHNVPNLMDVRTMIKILDVLGKKISFANNTLTVSTKKVSSRYNCYTAPYRLVSTMRASFTCLGPLIAKRKRAKISLPGGCVIGVRPVDLHIKGLRDLGVKIKVENGYCNAYARNLTGNHIYLGGNFGSSVLATANVLMAAVMAKGETIIEHAACEPEIENLTVFLKHLGALIQGEGTHVLRVKGVKSLGGGGDFTVIPDRIEAGTFIGVSLAIGSKLSIKKANPFHLTSVIETARNIGSDITIRKDNTIIVEPRKKLKPVSITTLPYPGFPTDLQAQFMVCLCLAKGVSLITEKIYPDRFMHVAELHRMGASIHRSGPYAIIEGKQRLYGAELMASDLRASAALIIAGLAAAGKTTINRVYHIDRGYERIEEKLKALGAKIQRSKS